MPTTPPTPTTPPDSAPEPGTDNWINLIDEVSPEEGAQLVRLLTEQEIPARVEGAALQVPEALEGDAGAVLAGADDSQDEAPEVDRARQLARLTAPVTPDPLNPMQAWDIVMRLHAAAIEATTDMPAFTNMETTGGCSVLVAPGDVPRARELIARKEAPPDDTSPAWLEKKAKAVVADGLTEEQGIALRRALGMHGLAAALKPEHGAFAVRVRPGDDSLAQDVLQRLALGARADAEAAATDAEAETAGQSEDSDGQPAGPAAGLIDGARDGEQASIVGTVLTLLALGFIAWIVMRACNG